MKRRSGRECTERGTDQSIAIAVRQLAAARQAALTFDRSALLWWTSRSASHARRALKRVPGMAVGAQSASTAILGLRSYYALDERNHALAADLVSWAKLIELQVTRQLAAALDGRPERVSAFLRALAPWQIWPDRLTDVRAAAEVTTRLGRIDLLVTGKAEGKEWGAVIEAKLGHHIRNNKMADYADYGARRAKLVFGKSDAERTGVLVVLGRTRDRHVDRHTNRNTPRRWTFVHWSSLLRRLERALDEQNDDGEFRQFRRAMWERCA